MLSARRALKELDLQRERQTETERTQIALTQTHILSRDFSKPGTRERIARHAHVDV